MTFVLVVFGTTACLYNIKFMRFLFFFQKGYNQAGSQIQKHSRYYNPRAWANL